MVTLAVTGKVENGGPVQITASTLPQRADHPLDKPAVDGRALYLRCLEVEHCPADWADKIDSEGIYHE